MLYKNNFKKRTLECIFLLKIDIEKKSLNFVETDKKKNNVRPI